MRLRNYSKGCYSTGASPGICMLWYFLGAPLLASAVLPSSRLKLFVLRAFGARIGNRVRIKPGVRVKLPWRLSVGDDSWIGEDVWIDNLAEVTIGSDCCLSQGAYLCTGSHDWKSPSFDLVTRPITLLPHAWIGAFARLAPGTKVGEGAVVTLGSVASGELRSWNVYRGNPAVAFRERAQTDGIVQ